MTIKKLLSIGIATCCLGNLTTFAAVNVPATPEQIMPKDKALFNFDDKKNDDLPKSSLELNNEEQQQTTTFDEQDLINKPELTDEFLNQALMQQRWDIVAKLIPIYSKQAKRDEILLQYATAALYREQGKIKESINIYRNLISQQPNSLRIRTDLAILLFMDHQNIAALDQFKKVRAEEKDERIIALYDQYIDAINKRSKWQFNVGFSYIQDDNVNNASSEKNIELGGNIFVKNEESLPQSARGFQLYLGGNRDFNFSGPHYWTVDLSLNGKWYPGDSRYNDVNISAYGGYKNKGVRSNWNVQPFFKFRSVANNAYSNTFGISAGYDNWLNNQWRVSVSGELGQENQIQLKDYKENQFFSSLNFIYAPVASRYFFFGVNGYNTVVPGDDSASYFRAGFNAGWNQDWGKGISTLTTIGISDKRYQAAGFYGFKRKDNEYDASLTLWNRNWHKWGVTPKITFSYHKVDSNFDALYSYDKSRVFLKFDKTF